jgi:Zn finger protein HypA/HybF involved in hydrogenase expression
LHEFGVTESLLRHLLAQLAREHITRVGSVRFRRSSAFSEDVLRQTFAALSAGTPLEGAELVVDVNILALTCAQCGTSGEASAGNLVGHIYVCPQCGAVREVKEAHDLELVVVSAVL